MIKSITTTRVARSTKEFESLATLFRVLGFEDGRLWKSAKARGQAFAAPVGKLEFIAGKQLLPADLWIEVTDLDTLNGLL
ncbi:hypothetical protein Q8G41_27740, partial [Klebsiella pneumoniae]|uniref:hypothetical protein n=1 Tax=Klebsiella pneumoniae TaxID=573 RepID=UPI0030138954